MVIQNFYSSINKVKWTILAAAVFTLTLLLLGINLTETRADQLETYISASDGWDCADLADEDYFTVLDYEPDTEIYVSTDTGIESLYIRWDQIPGEWTLRVNDQEYTYGQTGYIHEYIELPEEAKGTTELTILTGGSSKSIADIFAFSAGDLPGFVQTWEPSYEEADILLISSHADDEILFFGGIIPNYINRENVRIQVAYFNEYFSREGQSEPCRNHEILNGLWTMGVRHYPQLGAFYDAYMDTPEDAEAAYGHEESLEYTVRTIRRFKPQVVIGQDINNGEYGHGTHIWTARMIAEAVELTGDPDEFPSSAQEYGTWEVPKVYFHLYPEGQIELDARTRLSHFNGMTELEVASAAYEQHQSQQWTDFIVSDGYDEAGNPNGYEYSLTKYGLFRSLVGEDFSGNDILDNIVTYDDQIRIAEEEEAARIAKEEEERRLAEQKAEEERLAAEAEAAKQVTRRLILIVLGLAVAYTATLLYLINKQYKYRKRKYERWLAQQNQQTTQYNQHKFQKIEL